MRVEVRHVIEVNSRKHSYLVFSVVAVEDSGKEKLLETADFYPDARRIGKEHAVKHQAQLFDVDENKMEREIPLAGPFPALFADEAPSKIPKGFSVQERSSETKIIFPSLPGGFRLPEILASIVFVLAVSGLGFVCYRLASQHFSMPLVFVGIFSGVALLIFNPLNIWSSIQPRQNELLLGNGGVHHRHVLGTTVHQEKIAWNEIEDIIVSKDFDTELWDLRVVTTDDEFYLWSSEARDDLDWLKGTIGFAARQYCR